MSRQSRVQAPPPQPLPPLPPCPWSTTAGTNESMLTPNAAASYGMAALMQSVGTSAPPGWWNPTGSSPLMPQKDFSGLDSYPPDGFVSYLKNSSSPAISPNNINLGGGHFPYAPVLEPNPSMAKNKTPPSDGRTDKRLPWTKEEDERLFSAWLNNSNDPIAGNCKKGDRYWRDVTATYNSTTPTNRRREMNQLKDRFHRVNKKVGWFAASWQKASGIYASGQSDLQLRDKALKFYEEDYKDGEFKYMHCWKAVEGWPKWETYMQTLEKLKKRKISEVGEPLQDLAFGIDEEDDPRPPGNKSAKSEHYKNNAKAKGKTSIGIEIDEMEEKLEKFMTAQAEANKARNDMVEVARLNALAAKEKKEAKMLDTYKWLFSQDTTTMSDDMKVEHMKAVKSMSEKLFGTSD